VILFECENYLTRHTRKETAIVQIFFSV
jgi:hypothetical protein